MKTITLLTCLTFGLLANAKVWQLQGEANGIRQDQNQFNLKVLRRLLNGPIIQFVQDFESESRRLQEGQSAQGQKAPRNLFQGPTVQFGDFDEDIYTRKLQQQEQIIVLNDSNDRKLQQQSQVIVLNDLNTRARKLLQQQVIVLNNSPSMNIKQQSMSNLRNLSTQPFLPQN